MASEPSLQKQERSILRDTYRAKASNLDNLLRTQPQRTYSEANLKDLGVDLASFDPEDAAFLEYKACFFGLI